MKTAAAVLMLALAAPAAAQEWPALPAVPRFSRGAAADSAFSVPGAPLEAPDVSSYPLRGADVSMWQDAIDWDALGRAGLSFVFVKATEGAAKVDAGFSRNWAGAKKAGLRRGAYHYWDFCGSGAAQAAHVVAVLPRDDEDLPLTVDLEDSRPCRLPAREVFQKSFGVFLARVEKAYGKKPLLYVNSSIYERYLSGGGDHGLRLWISDPHHAAPAMPSGASWTFWQYSFRGALPGIGGAVDLDVFNGDAGALAELARPAAPAAPAAARLRRR
jgi:lysozyme